MRCKIMTSMLKQLSKVSIHTKYSVYGWVREAETELRMGDIPLMIQTICILYYRDDDVFDKIDENGFIIESKDNYILNHCSVVN